MAEQSITNKFSNASYQPAIEVDPDPDHLAPYHMTQDQVDKIIKPELWENKSIWSRITGDMGYEESHSPGYKSGLASWIYDQRLTKDERKEVQDAVTQAINNTPIENLRKSHNECATLVGTVFRAKAAGGAPYATVLTWAPRKWSDEIVLQNVPVILASSYRIEQKSDTQRNNAKTLLSIANESFGTNASSMEQLLGDKAAVAFPIPMKNVSSGRDCSVRGINYN